MEERKTGWDVDVDGWFEFRMYFKKAVRVWEREEGVVISRINLVG